MTERYSYKEAKTSGPRGWRMQRLELETNADGSFTRRLHPHQDDPLVKHKAREAQFSADEIDELHADIDRHLGLKRPVTSEGSE